jgi:hypothetical protein
VSKGLTLTIIDIHIENLCKKICSGIGALRRIKPFVPLRSLKLLYKALIQPYFDYCPLCGIHAGRSIKINYRCSKIERREL